MVVPPGGVERRLDMGTQLETFSYLTLSKPLLSSNAFWAKSFSQTLKNPTTPKSLKRPHLILTRDLARCSARSLKISWKRNTVINEEPA